MPPFKKPITEAALHQYAASLNAVPLPTPSGEPFPPPGQKIPRYMVSSTLDPEMTHREYVYIGMHHTFVSLNGTYSNTTTRAEFLREPEEAVKTGSKLNSIFTRGVLPTSNKCRKLLYGPGVYLTQRPAIGNLAAAGGLLNLAPEELAGDGTWEIIQIHVFVPLATYKTWRKVGVKLVPDADAFHKDSLVERIRAEDGLDDFTRAKYGLEGAADIVVAKGRAKPHPAPAPVTVTHGNQKHRVVIEEITLPEEALRDAKLLAEVIPMRSRFLSYMAYRAAHRYLPRQPNGLEWSEVAVRVLEEGDSQTGTLPIESTRTYQELSGYLADFDDLEERKPGEVHRYWKAFEGFRERYEVK